VKPKNQVGWGTAFSPVLSVLCDTYPSAMGLPTAVSVKPKEIVISWTPLMSDSDTGRDPIQAY
jgi:hypothetical protein